MFNIFFRPILTGLFLLFLFSLPARAHNGEDHAKDTAKKEETIKNDHQHKEELHTKHEHSPAVASEAAAAGEFPHLHPLFVHIPISFICITALIVLVNLLLRKREFDWLILGFIAIGVISAYVAGKWFHPHTHGISEQAKHLLTEHDFWADWTIYLGFVGLIVQFAYVFVLKGKRWVSAIAYLFILGSAYAIFHAGHYGAALVHIEGVGPQGKYLEQHHNH